MQALTDVCVWDQSPSVNHGGRGADISDTNITINKKCDKYVIN